MVSRGGEEQIVVVAFDAAYDVALVTDVWWGLSQVCLVTYATSRGVFFRMARLHECLAAVLCNKLHLDCHKSWESIGLQSQGHRFGTRK